MQNTLKLIWTLPFANSANLLPASTQVVTSPPGSPTEEIRHCSGEENNVQAAVIDSKTVNINQPISWEIYIFFQFLQKFTFSFRVIRKRRCVFPFISVLDLNTSIKPTNEGTRVTCSVARPEQVAFKITSDSEARWEILKVSFFRSNKLN